VGRAALGGKENNPKKEKERAEKKSPQIHLEKGTG